MIFMIFIELLLRYLEFDIYQKKDQKKITKKLFFLAIHFFTFYKYLFIIKFNMTNNRDFNILIKISLYTESWKYFVKNSNMQINFLLIFY